MNNTTIRINGHLRTLPTVCKILDLYNAVRWAPDYGTLYGVTREQYQFAVWPLVRIDKQIDLSKWVCCAFFTVNNRGEISPLFDWERQAQQGKAGFGPDG